MFFHRNQFYYTILKIMFFHFYDFIWFKFPFLIIILPLPNQISGQIAHLNGFIQHTCEFLEMKMDGTGSQSEKE